MVLQEKLRSKVSQNGIDLFAVFSRFEYAMKAGGFRRTTSADAAWHTFADALGEQFYNSAKANPDLKILFEQPPRTLIPNTSGGVEWDANPKLPANIRDLVDCIKTVRNNLFHGEKLYHNDRDESLICASLLLLNLFYELASTKNEFKEFTMEIQSTF